MDHGKRQIVFDRPLVKFVKYDVRNALEKWIGAKIAQQNARCDEEEPRFDGDFFIESDVVTDGFADV